MKFKETYLFIKKILLKLCAGIVILSTISCMVSTWQPVIESSDLLSLDKNKDVLFITIKRSFEKETNIAEDWRKSNKEKSLSSSDWEYETLQKTLGKYLSTKKIVDGTQLEKGQTFIDITLYKDYEASYSHKDWCEASWMTGSIIPCYGDLSVHHAEYVLYKGQVEQRKYFYTYSRRGAWWIVLLPFVWINLFTNSQEDALVGTAHQFLTEAKKDGLL